MTGLRRLRANSRAEARKRMEREQWATAYQRDSARIDAEVDRILSRIDAEVDRILSMSDAEIIAEITASGEDPKAIADHMREVFERAVSKVEAAK